MIQKNEQIFSDALNMSPSDRSRLAARLIQSLENSEPTVPSQWETEWNEVCERRNADIESGNVVPISSVEAFDRLSRRVNVRRDD